VCLGAQATTYLQLIGILLGQLFFGFLGDAVGRKFAMLADSAVILIGIILLTCASGPTPQVCAALCLGALHAPDMQHTLQPFMLRML
jgi:MFS family permease